MGMCHLCMQEKGKHLLDCPLHKDYKGSVFNYWNVREKKKEYGQMEEMRGLI